ncbi:MAG: GIY-YIG nuclease family protein [Patescibacteria group bacterium]|nr:GIY-YIG nuclease family protein [Patescibacteria group bacterium]
MSYYVYIVQCSDGSFYTGIATNLERRLRQHNGELKGGAVYTRRAPVRLVHMEEFGTHLEAVRREVEIKGWTREKKERLFILR